MNISIQVNSARAPEGLESHTARLVHEALAGFGPAISRVRVSIGDITGSAAGADAYCKVQVHGPELQPIRIGTVNAFKGAADPHAAVALAVDRVTRAVGRRIAQNTSPRPRLLAA